LLDISLSNTSTTQLLLLRKIKCKYKIEKLLFEFSQYDKNSENK
ncbi:7138_t:CDS:1, partial [Scutellospora calospora]